MSDEATIDFNIGSNEAREFRFRDFDGVLMDLAGSRFVMTLYRGTTRILTKDTAVDLNFVVQNDVTLQLPDGTTTTGDRLLWTPTVDESRLIPPGRLVRAEIERRISGTQEPWGKFMLNGIGGFNLD